MTHICVAKLTNIGSDNGLSPGRRQAIIWTNAGLLLIEPLGTNFSEILIEILTFSFKKMRLKVPSAKRWPFCLGLNGLTYLWFALCTNHRNGKAKSTNYIQSPQDFIEPQSNCHSVFRTRRAHQIDCIGLHTLFDHNLVHAFLVCRI